MNSGAISKEAFGAAVVSQTLDNLNNTQNKPAPVDKESFGAAVVSQTLDNLNNNSATSVSGADYQFQKDVLSAAYSGKGTIVDVNN